MLSVLRRETLALLLIGPLSILVANASIILAFQPQMMVATGKVENVEGNTITFDNHKRYVPADEHAFVPDWATPGTVAKISYYIQNYTNYYYEIVRQGERLKVEEGMKSGKKTPR